jgi:Rieske Fe-S protein
MTVNADASRGRSGKMSPVFERMKQAPGAMVHFVADRISKADTLDTEGLASGEGALVQMDGKKLAVYRDEDGKLHAMSPVCRHMKCIVDWNAAEKTWDCPCHGSRYDAMGHVIQGPAKKNLVHESID